MGDWAGGEGIDVPTVSQVWADFCAPVDTDGVKRAFEVLDLDDSGAISWVELSMALKHAADTAGVGGSAAPGAAKDAVVAPKNVDAIFNRARAASGHQELAERDFQTLWRADGNEALVTSLQRYVATKVRVATHSQSCLVCLRIFLPAGLVLTDCSVCAVYGLTARSG